MSSSGSTNPSYAARDRPGIPLMSYTQQSENDPDASTTGNATTTAQGSSANTDGDDPSCLEGVRKAIQDTIGHESRKETARQIMTKTDGALSGVSDTRQAVARGVVGAAIVAGVFPCDACGDKQLGWCCGGCGVE